MDHGYFEKLPEKFWHFYWLKIFCIHSKVSMSTNSQWLFIKSEYLNILGAYLEVLTEIQEYQGLSFDRTKLSKLRKLSFLIFEFHKNFRNWTSSQVYVRKITKWHPDIIKNSFFSLFTTKCDNEREFSELSLNREPGLVRWTLIIQTFFTIFKFIQSLIVLK